MMFYAKLFFNVWIINYYQLSILKNSMFYLKKQSIINDKKTDNRKNVFRRNC